MGFLAILIVVFFRIFTGDIAGILMELGRFASLEFIYDAGRWLSVDNWNVQLTLAVPIILMMVYLSSAGAKQQEA